MMARLNSVTAVENNRQVHLKVGYDVGLQYLQYKHYLLTFTKVMSKQGV